MCGDDADLRRAVPLLLHLCGFELVAAVPFGAELVGAVQRTRPDVVALDITAAGIEGLGLVGRVMDACEGCAVVVRTPFAALEADAVAAGAVRVVGLDDLRPLLQVLQQLRAAAHQGISCPCCPAPAPAGVEPPGRPVPPPEASGGTTSTYVVGPPGGPGQPGTSSSSTNAPDA